MQALPDTFSKDDAALPFHQQIILRRWLLISKMDPSSPLPSPCVSVCRVSDENICMGCFRSLDEISDWAKSNPDHQLRIWKNLIERIGLAYPNTDRGKISI
jgi:predicted Fe-S protein YdhL (DUF1289 family)